MVTITVMYAGLVYLLFFKLGWLPWNKTTRLVSVGIGILIVFGFLVGLENLTPSSSLAIVTGRVVDIAPQVPGEVIRVAVGQDEEVEEGAILFEIDPTLFRAQVKELEASVALARLRLGQLSQLATVDAASRFEVERTEAEIAQLEARLEGARFNLENATVRAPFSGRVPKQALKRGVQVSPGRSVMTLVDTEALVIAALVPQKALPNVALGDHALVSFPALPGRVFDTEVRAFQSAIGEGQIFATGRLEGVQQRRMVRVFPLFLDLPDDFPADLRRVGLAANVTIVTEGAGPVAIIAMVTQWMRTAQGAIL